MNQSKSVLLSFSVAMAGRDVDGNPYCRRTESQDGILRR